MRCEQSENVTSMAEGRVSRVGSREKTSGRQCKVRLLLDCVCICVGLGVLGMSGQPVSTCGRQRFRGVGSDAKRGGLEHQGT
ncbi:hypothetical protein B0H67DRAFT_313681 [Lasiosphaeris hirsuta]|uniref:Uncharacterized protein n=1 Tax=Lasiosphaeris hirsuta TaxID=260670 RepID=A0AA40DKX8_9PEZI|nr:hypothetical protein B0H67DRAFT_313681 [Lasiosphaeris hirsuta]